MRRPSRTNALELAESHHEVAREVQFLPLSTIRRAVVDPYELLNRRVHKLYDLERWRSPSAIDIDPYTRMLSDYIRLAKRRLEPNEREVFLESAFRIVDGLTVIADRREGTPTQRVPRTLEVASA